MGGGGGGSGEGVGRTAGMAGMSGSCEGRLRRMWSFPLGAGTEAR